MDEPSFIDNQNPASQFFNAHNYKIGEFTFSSIQHGFYYLLFLHNEGSEKAKLVANNPLFRRNPVVISLHMDDKLHITRPDSLFYSPVLYCFIMEKILSTDRNLLESEFQKVLAKHGESSKFLLPNSHAEVKWSCGMRRSLIESGLKYDGFNTYGRVVCLAFNLWRQKSTRSDLLDKLLAQKTPFPSPYSKTVLLLSDSYAKYTSKIQGGDVLPFSGGRYDSLVRLLKAERKSIKDYRYLIINCGFNCGELVGNTFRSQENHWLQVWKPLEQAIEAAVREAPQLRIVLNSGICLPKARGHLPAHTRFIKERFRSNFSDENKFFFFDWSQIDNNPFFKQTPDGNMIPNPVYFDVDGVHTNHFGFRLFWTNWCSVLPELKQISYSMTPVGYQQNLTSTLFHSRIPANRKRKM